MRCFAVERLGLVYQKVDKDKVVSECELNGMLLGND